MLALFPVLRRRRRVYLQDPAHAHRGGHQGGGEQGHQPLPAGANPPPFSMISFKSPLIAAAAAIGRPC